MNGIFLVDLAFECFDTSYWAIIANEPDGVAEDLDSNVSLAYAMISVRVKASIQLRVYL